eukprot:7072875-Alexandrium_andersonii.AAC.2
MRPRPRCPPASRAKAQKQGVRAEARSAHHLLTRRPTPTVALARSASSRSHCVTRGRASTRPPARGLF